MFNNTEREMIQRTSKAGKTARESAWRDRLSRYASSGQSIEAFCQSESVSSASFYGWRSRLRAQDAGATADWNALPGTSPFIDLGPVNAAVSASAAGERTAAVPERRSNVEVRIDLGDGVLLTIARR